MRFLTFHFETIGAKASYYNGMTIGPARADLVQLACDYIMDVLYPMSDEHEVIENYRDIMIDWTAQTVSVPVKTVYTVH